MSQENEQTHFMRQVAIALREAEFSDTEGQLTITFPRHSDETEDAHLSRVKALADYIGNLENEDAEGIYVDEGMAGKVVIPNCIVPDCGGLDLV